MSIQVGTATAVPGRIVRGEIPMGSLADGSPIRVPVLLAAGEEEGPRVWVQGCIHGEEFGGAASILHFLQNLDLSQLRGTVVAIPVANPSSFNARSRFSGLDGHNLNRIFPGNPRGTHSQQLAAELAAALAGTADYLVDLHSGGIGAEVPFYVIYKDDGSPVAQRSLALAKRVGCQVIWRSQAGGGEATGTVTAAALRAGVPAVTVECGGGTFTPQHLRDYVSAITNALRAVGALPGEPVTQEQYTIIGNGSFLFNREGGLFVPECEVGSILAADGLIGRLINPYGDTVEEIRSPADNAYIAALRLPYYPTHSGEIVAEAIPVESHVAL